MTIDNNDNHHTKDSLKFFWVIRRKIVILHPELPIGRTRQIEKNTTKIVEWNHIS